jgi:hypothetical protein
MNDVYLTFHALPINKDSPQISADSVSLICIDFYIKIKKAETIIIEIVERCHFDMV